MNKIVQPRKSDGLRGWASYFYSLFVPRLTLSRGIFLVNPSLQTTLTAKANALDPYRYLLFLLEEFPNADRCRADWMEPFLPWNAPDDCRMTHE